MDQEEISHYRGPKWDYDCFNRGEMKTKILKELFHPGETYVKISHCAAEIFENIQHEIWTDLKA